MRVFFGGAGARARLSALEQSHASIEFELDGSIVAANDLFLRMMGYSRDEVIGRNHNLFVDPAERETQGYKDFWAHLRAGEYQRAEFRRLGKGGAEIWLRASYNPVRGRRGAPARVLTFATDVTQQKLRNAEVSSQLEAISRSQGVAEFTLDGEILTANENFLAMVGYSLDELRGRRHGLLCEPGYAESSAYRELWRALARGEHRAERFRRRDKGGRTIWIQGAYNPVLDQNGKPYKVVKFAMDVTAQTVDAERREQARRAIDVDLMEVAAAVSDATQEADMAASASVETAATVESVAVGASQLALSVTEISAQVNRARSVSVQAVEESKVAHAVVASLSDAAGRIGQIVEFISAIAAQTNLLALNATIEAARAGQTGRGFAVVASEVKELAAQTARATGEVAGQIEAVQRDARQAVDAIDGILKTIVAIEDVSASIATAIEEQSTVTSAMSESMKTAAEGVGGISRSMNEIARSTRLIDDAARKVRDASRSIA